MRLTVGLDDLEDLFQPKITDPFSFPAETKIDCILAVCKHLKIPQTHKNAEIGCSSVCIHLCAQGNWKRRVQDSSIGRSRTDTV